MLTSFQANFWPCTIFPKFITIEEASGQRREPGGPTLGPADPTGRPTQGQWLLGPTFSNGYLTIVSGPSSGALAQFLQIEAERGVMSSHAHSHSLSHILARISFGF